MNIELDEHELKIVFAGLGKLPLEMAILVYGKLQKQVMEQKEDVS
jgi:hypothetical protein